MIIFTIRLLHYSRKILAIRVLASDDTKCILSRIKMPHDESGTIVATHNNALSRYCLQMETCVVISHCDVSVIAPNFLTLTYYNIFLQCWLLILVFLASVSQLFALNRIFQQQGATGN